MPKNSMLSGLSIILLGIGIIIIAWIFKQLDIPDIILGFYTAPLVIIIGGIVIIRNSNPPKK